MEMSDWYDTSMLPRIDAHTGSNKVKISLVSRDDSTSTSRTSGWRRWLHPLSSDNAGLLQYQWWIQHFKND
jgi:hypothetical protein